MVLGYKEIVYHLELDFFAVCNVKSGNDSSNVGFLINGEPVTWEGRHIVINGQTILLRGNLVL